MTANTLLRTIALPSILAIVTASASAADFDRTLTAGNSPEVNVGTGAGYINMRPGSGSQIHIVGHVHADHSWPTVSGDIDARIKQIAANPPINQSGNTVIIGERRNNDDLYQHIVIDYDITLPRTSAITASTGSGSVDIEDVGSRLTAHSGSGSIRAHGIQGAAALQTGSGHIELDHTGPGEIHAQTGSGSIHLNGVDGTLYARTGSGAIEVTGKPAPDWKLDTGSGSIHLNVGKAPFTLNASTGSGGIHVDQPLGMQTDLNRHHITATVNGGGPSVSANTGSGDIRVQ